MKCKLKEICVTLYSIDCKQSYKYNKNCLLINNIKDGKVNNFIVSLIEKKLNKTSIKNDKKYDLVECPRSSHASPVLISSPCILNNCPYFSEKVSYNCFLIHQKIFFSDYEFLSHRLLEIGTDLNAIEFQQIIDLSIYLSRMYIILLNYNSDYLHIKNDLLTLPFMKKYIPKTSDNISICQICSGIYNNNKICSCIDNSQLREKRLSFSKHWSYSIKKLQYEIRGIDNLIPKELCQKYINEIDKLKFLKSLMNHVIIENISFTDIPFSYVFYMGSLLFTDSEYKLSKSFGINRKKYKQAKIIFNLK